MRRALVVRVNELSAARLRVRLLYAPKPDSRITVPASILELSAN